MVGSGVYSQEPEYRLFLVASVAAGVYPNGGEFTTFAPAFDGEGGDTEKLGNFGDGEKVREVVKIKLFFGCFIKWGLILIVHV